MNSEFELSDKKTLINVHGNEEEDLAETASEGEMSACKKVTEDLFVEAAATCEPEGSTGSKSIATNKDLDVKRDNKQLLSPEQNVVFKADGNDDETLSPGHERDVKELIQELRRERNQASRLNGQLQTKLTGYFQKRHVTDGRLQRDRPESEQQQEYEKHLHLLTDLQLQLRAAAASAQQQAEELRLQELKKLDEVEEEWRALVALKQDAAVSALSRRLGKEAAWAKVQSVLMEEQLQQDELTKARLRHFKLRLKIRRLETELREWEELSRDPLQIQIEQLQARRLEEKKQAEKQREESLKLQKKTGNSLELLSNVKEKLFWSQMEVQAKRQQLTELEAVVATRKDLLTRTKQTLNQIQRDNLRLNERRGLLGNRVLLRDFEDTLDASDHLEKHLDDLKYQQAQAVFKCGRWKRRQETTLINE